jgi:CMP-N-acetylneuraminic acid synthetase
VKKKIKKNILGVITARGGSKGIPYKNIKILGDKPLIAYTIEVAKKSRLITHLIVSTDDKKIARIAEKYGANVPFLRPKILANDETPTLPVIQHAVRFMEEMIGIKFDYTVILQPTSPLRIVEDIDKTVELLINTGADSAVSLVETEASAHPIKMKKIENNRVLAYCIEESEGIRRQDLPIAYKRSGAVYAQTRETIMYRNMLYGDYIVGHIIPKARYIDIDDEFDWVKAEYMLKRVKNL